MLSVVAAVKRSRRRSRVDVVRRRLSQLLTEGEAMSGAMRRRAEAQRRVMVWWVVRRVWVSVKGGCWRMDCWVFWGVIVVVFSAAEAVDSRKKARWVLFEVS